MVMMWGVSITAEESVHSRPTRQVIYHTEITLYKALCFYLSISQTSVSARMRRREERYPYPEICKDVRV